MQVNAGAFAPLASEIDGIVFVEVARGSNKRVALRTFIATLFSVNGSIARAASAIERLL